MQKVQGVDVFLYEEGLRVWSFFNAKRAGNARRETQGFASLTKYIIFISESYCFDSERREGR